MGGWGRRWDGMDGGNVNERGGGEERTGGWEGRRVVGVGVGMIGMD